MEIKIIIPGNPRTKKTASRFSPIRKLAGRSLLRVQLSRSMRRKQEKLFRRMYAERLMIASL